MNQNILVIISIISAIFGILLTAYALFILYKIKKTRTELNDGAASSNLEEILRAIGNKIKKLEQNSTTQQKSLEVLNNFTQFSLHKIGIHKFNALPDEGGNMSFSLALLDNTNSGILLSSMSGRSHNRLYAKLVTHGQSASQLTDEEQTALAQASAINKNINR